MKKFLLVLTAVLFSLSLTTIVSAYEVTQVGTGVNEDFSDNYWNDYDLVLLQKFDVDSDSWFNDSTTGPTYSISNVSWTSGTWYSTDPLIGYFSLNAGSANGDLNGGGYILYRIEGYSADESYSLALQRKLV